MLFGPRKEVHRKTAHESWYYASLLDLGVAGSEVSPEGHLAILQCLIEDLVEHSDVKAIVDKRVEDTDAIRLEMAQVRLVQLVLRVGITLTG